MKVTPLISQDPLSCSQKRWEVGLRNLENEEGIELGCFTSQASSLDPKLLCNIRKKKIASEWTHFKAKFSVVWMPIYLHKNWGYSWAGHLVRSIHVGQVTTTKEQKYPKISDNQSIFRSWRMHEDNFTAAINKASGEVRFKVWPFSEHLFSTLSLPCQLLLGPLWGAQIPTDCHSKRNWNSWTWLLLSMGKEAGYLRVASHA